MNGETGLVGVVPERCFVVKLDSVTVDGKPVGTSETPCGELSDGVVYQHPDGRLVYLCAHHADVKRWGAICQTAK